MEKLTGRQSYILEVLKKLIAENGYPPTVREIGEKAHLSSPATIHFHLKKLEEKGYIKKDDNKNRTIEILVPNEYFSLPTNLITTKNDVFTLKVSGESMINVGIYDGDILIVERKNTARNGETVVAMNENNEATVKTFYKENGYFRLQPENDTMDPIILKEVTILGKVIGLYRKL